MFVRGLVCHVSPFFTPRRGEGHFPRQLASEHNYLEHHSIFIIHPVRLFFFLSRFAISSRHLLYFFRGPPLLWMLTYILSILVFVGYSRRCSMW